MAISNEERQRSLEPFGLSQASGEPREMPTPIGQDVVITHSILKYL